MKEVTPSREYTNICSESHSKHSSRILEMLLLGHSDTSRVGGIPKLLREKEVAGSDMLLAQICHPAGPLECSGHR